MKQEEKETKAKKQECKTILVQLAEMKVGEVKRLPLSCKGSWKVSASTFTRANGKIAKKDGSWEWKVLFKVTTRQDHFTIERIR